MDHKPCPSKAILPLIAALLVLPISISVLVAVSALWLPWVTPRVG